VEILNALPATTEKFKVYFFLRTNKQNNQLNIGFVVVVFVVVHKPSSRLVV